MIRIVIYYACIIVLIQGSCFRECKVVFLNIVLISDSIEATGCENGNYMLGDLQVVKNGNKAVLLSDATVLAGSVSNLYDCLKTAVTKMSIPFALALRASTYNPAKSIGLDNEIGLIDVGRKANILIVDNELNICEVL